MAARRRRASDLKVADVCIPLDTLALSGSGAVLNYSFDQKSKQ
jgi:hypothetical protein